MSRIFAAWVLCFCVASALGCHGDIQRGPVANGGGGGDGASGFAGVNGFGVAAQLAGTGGSGTGGTQSAGMSGQLIQGVGADAGNGAGAGAGAGDQAGAGAGAGGAAGTGSVVTGDPVNPAPGSAFFMGANFWNIEWEGSDNYFASNVDWATTDNPWNDQFLQDLAPYHVLRFMDWNQINESDNPQADWNTRIQTKADQGAPVAFEWQIDLCNRSLKDYWVNIPHAADADYIDKLASMIRDKLDPRLRVYVEWSNEIWNGSFPQRAYAEGRGEALGLSGEDKAAAYLVYQSVRVFEAFEAVFGSNSQRVVKVIAGQAAWTGPCEAHLAALRDTTINPKGTKPSVYAIAPYIYGESVDELANDAIAETAAWVEDNVECAQAAGLPLIAYEGGQDSYSLGEDGCAELQVDSGMRETYKKFLDALSQANLKGPFVHYTHSGDCWGLKRKTSDAAEDSPKYQGMLDWLSEHP